MPMKTPAHPGRIVRSACLEPLGLSVTAGQRFLASPGKRSTTWSMARPV